MSSLAMYGRFGHPDIKFEHKHMVLYNVPESIQKAIPALPKRIYLNKIILAPLAAVFNNIATEGLGHLVETWDGCFNVRPIRGYEKKYSDLVRKGLFSDAARYLSVHAWGAAVDINLATNRMGQEPQMDPRIIECFVNAGFTWGGNFKRKDGMHFEYRIK